MIAFLPLGYFLVAIIVSYIVINNDLPEVLLSAAPPRSSGRSHRPSSIRSRFPKFGTPEFSRQCNWTFLPQSDDCTFFVRPKPESTEGISDWISAITKGYLLAKQAGCRLLLDYGPGVDVQGVLSLQSTLDSSSNWLVPVDFDCKEEERCFRVGYPGGTPESWEYHGKDLALVPAYRFVYQANPRFQLQSIHYQDLQTALPGFRVETGMACSLERLFRLSPTASQFEPRLFTSILPKLQDEEALVLALYIRTGEVDVKAKQEKTGQISPKEDTTLHRDCAKQILNCTLFIEGWHLSGLLTESTVDTISRVIWMVITDSPDVKDWIHESYDGENANARVPIDQQKWPGRIIPREILFTKSHGKHTRTKVNPSSVDFAEALIDWYLIGESDLVIGYNYAYSFGATAALRTARPFYSSSTCSKLVLLH